MNIFLAQIIGSFAVSFFIFSIQFKKRKDILKIQFIANILYAIQYFVLNVFIAGYMNIISGIRCLIFYQYDKKKKKIPSFLLYIFIALIILIGIINYNNFLSLIPIIITLFYIISSYYKDTKVIRYVFLICSIIWLFYNFKVEAYVSLIGNVFEFTSGIIAIIRFRKK